ncbi:MAG: alpha-L-fucosidase [Chitinophagaceae bacterium]|nr:alpha-L-fucosidase [Chitinophagaceae bacterium]
MKKIFPLLMGFFGLAIFLPSILAAQDIDGKWKPDWDNLKNHEAPEWLLDAKLGIQYVGAPRNFSDQDYWHWSRAQQRARQLASRPDYESITEIDRKAKNLNVDYVWPIEYDNPKTALQHYVELGAKFIVSMEAAVIYGTEGLLMTKAEVEEARKLGLKVGLHYNFQRWGGQPSIGDPGFVNWMIPSLKKAIVESDADFLFFDGKQLPSSYLNTPQLVSWYYNWADKNNKEVWINDDLGSEFGPLNAPCDVIGFECMVPDRVSARPWLLWDCLRNEWNCWVNEYGMHVRTGDKWQWMYKPTDELLQVFLDAVSKGGGWLIQMINTEKAWKTLAPIGEWLKVNGEAIYSTRPYLPAAENIGLAPNRAEVQLNGRFDPALKTQDWWYKWSFVYKESLRNAPWYLNKSKDEKTLYAIHWGWPGSAVLLQDVNPVKGSAIYMLGSNEKLEWKQIGKDILIQTPKDKPCDYAYSFKIQLKS